MLDDEYVRSHADACPGPHVMLAITDTGVGMDHETKENIFEPFFTTKELGHGTGLGLSTVYGIVKQSGGNIWVYSEVGHGTTFKIYLPVSAKDVKPARPRKAEPAPPTGTETILVVEDEAAVRILVVGILQASGYTVLTAEDADEALELTESHDGEIHLLLTDIILPGLNGPQLAEAFAELRPEAKVVFMSGYTDDAIVHRGELEEGTEFLEKPVRPGTVLEAVRGALADRDPE